MNLDEQLSQSSTRNSLFYSHNINVEQSYIITLKNNSVSENYSRRCQESCRKVEMPFTVWDAFDGTQGTIDIPGHSKNSDIMKMLKVTDHYLTRTELACALSHISLWVKCVLIDSPIVVLEHDAIMVRKFEHHGHLNSIVYLGGREWAKKDWKIYPIPPHASEGPNYLFICRAHAYSIDPMVAKNLIAHVIKFGICAPLDIMMRADLFNITHQGLYAFDDSELENTINKRPDTGRSTKLNSNLEV